MLVWKSGVALSLLKPRCRTLALLDRALAARLEEETNSICVLFVLVFAFVFYFCFDFHFYLYTLLLFLFFVLTFICIYTL